MLATVDWNQVAIIVATALVTGLVTGIVEYLILRKTWSWETSQRRIDYRRHRVEQKVEALDGWIAAVMGVGEAVREACLLQHLAASGGAIKEGVASNLRGLNARMEVVDGLTPELWGAASVYLPTDFKKSLHDFHQKAKQLRDEWQMLAVKILRACDQERGLSQEELELLKSKGKEVFESWLGLLLQGIRLRKQIDEILEKVGQRPHEPLLVEFDK